MENRDLLLLGGGAAVLYFALTQKGQQGDQKTGFLGGGGNGGASSIADIVKGINATGQGLLTGFLNEQDTSPAAGLLGAATPAAATGTKKASKKASMSPEEMRLRSAFADVEDLGYGSVQTLQTGKDTTHEILRIDEKYPAKSRDELSSAIISYAGAPLLDAYDAAVYKTSTGSYIEVPKKSSSSSVGLYAEIEDVVSGKIDIPKATSVTAPTPPPAPAATSSKSSTSTSTTTTKKTLSVADALKTYGVPSSPSGLFG